MPGIARSSKILKETGNSGSCVKTPNFKIWPMMVKKNTYIHIPNRTQLCPASKQCKPLVLKTNISRTWKDQTRVSQSQHPSLLGPDHSMLGGWGVLFLEKCPAASWPSPTRCQSTPLKSQVITIKNVSRPCWWGGKTTPDQSHWTGTSNS